MGIDEQARLEREVARAGEGINGMEFIPHVFPGLSVGAVGVGVERDVAKVDAASSATDPTHPSDRTGSALAGPDTGTGKAGMGLTGTLRSTPLPVERQTWLWSSSMRSAMGPLMSGCPIHLSAKKSPAGEGGAFRMSLASDYWKR